MSNVASLEGDVPISVVTVPCLSDNYAYLVHNDATGETALVDAPEARPILKELSARKWQLDTILLTHHHADHVMGVGELRRRFGSKVVGHHRDAHRLPRLDLAVSDGETIQVCGRRFSVLDVSGHTVGHIAFITEGAAFTADSLMALGCGKVFEGTFSMMWNSLQKLAKLPSDTLIFSGHEYTLSNARFALSVEPANKALLARVEEVKARRGAGLPTVPSELSVELATNPFLRARLPEVKALLGMSSASDSEVFGEVRTRKDRF